MGDVDIQISHLAGTFCLAHHCGDSAWHTVGTFIISETRVQVSLQDLLFLQQHDFNFFLTMTHSNTDNIYYDFSFAYITEQKLQETILHPSGCSADASAASAAGPRLAPARPDPFSAPRPAPTSSARLQSALSASDPAAVHA